jgi:hypothetical protein
MYIIIIINLIFNKVYQIFIQINQGIYIYCLLEYIYASEIQTFKYTYKQSIY